MRSPEKKDPSPIDEVDRFILRIMLQDSRTPAKDIAKALLDQKILRAPTTAGREVGKRLKALKRAGHLQLRAWVRPNSVGRSTAAVFLVRLLRHRVSLMEDFEQHVLQCLDCRAIDQWIPVSGEFDYVLSVTGSSPAAIEKTRAHLIATLEQFDPGGGARVETLIATENLINRPICIE